LGGVMRRLQASVTIGGGMAMQHQREPVLPPVPLRKLSETGAQPPPASSAREQRAEASAPRRHRNPRDVGEAVVHAKNMRQPSALLTTKASARPRASSASGAQAAESLFAMQRGIRQET
jgi:hypothetical protein